MVRKHLLDTDILIYFFRHESQVVRRVEEYLAIHSTLSVSTITCYEVLRGLRYVNASRKLDEFQQFVESCELLHLTPAAIEHAADVYVFLRREGQLINEADILIAGIAMANDAVLVTNNTDHFSRIAQLTITNWLK